MPKLIDEKQSFDTRLGVRWHPDAIALCREAAADLGMDLSEWVRAVLTLAHGRSAPLAAAARVWSTYHHRNETARRQSRL